jgi:hypothetical protein
VVGEATYLTTTVLSVAGARFVLRWVVSQLVFAVREHTPMPGGARLRISDVVAGNVPIAKLAVHYRRAPVLARKMVLETKHRLVQLAMPRFERGTFVDPASEDVLCVHFELIGFHPVRKVR